MRGNPNPPTERRLFVFLFQLGGPENLDAIEPFLENLLSDVLPGPGFVRRPLARLIAAKRSVRVRPLYAAIGGGSPLRANTDAQALALKARMLELGYQIEVRTCMRYAPPRVFEALTYARREFCEATWIALPLYPQFSQLTTGSSFTELRDMLTAAEEEHLVCISAYPEDDLFCEAQVECIQTGLNRFSVEERSSTHILFSAHGLPERQVRRGDPYLKQVQQTVNGVLAQLDVQNNHSLAFQSRLGPLKWLGPNTCEQVLQLGALGVKNLLVVPVSFVSENLETLYELDIELKEIAQKSGINHFERAPTPGVSPTFIASLASQIIRALPR